jgi:thioredoxin reductase
MHLVFINDKRFGGLAGIDAAIYISMAKLGPIFLRNPDLDA